VVFVGRCGAVLSSRLPDHRPVAHGEGKHRCPKCACRACEKHGSADDTAGIVQAPAPNRLIEGGLPAEALVAGVASVHVGVSVRR